MRESDPLFSIFVWEARIVLIVREHYARVVFRRRLISLYEPVIRVIGHWSAPDHKHTLDYV